MQNKINLFSKLFVVCFMLIASEVFAIANPFIPAESIIQATKIPNTNYFCVYTAGGDNTCGQKFCWLLLSFGHKCKN